MLNLTIVDADSIYFRIACVTKKQKDIRKSIDYTMNEIRRECMSDGLMVAVKGHGNFRKDLYPAYKKNRKELDDEMKKALKFGHEYMCDRWNAVMSNGMEADDLVSIWAHEAREQELDYVIVGIDKDLLQIPGEHYNFVKRSHQFIDDNTGDFNLSIQCLTGDATDNIPGIRGIGPKKAATILHGVPMQRRWNRVRAAWRQYNAGNPELSRNLLRMMTTWEEYEDVRGYIENQAAIRKQNVLEERQTHKEDNRLHRVSERNTRRDDRDPVAFRER